MGSLAAKPADDNQALAGTLSLGLFFAWSTFGWNHGEDIFGVAPNAGLSHHLCIQLAVGLTFLTIAFARAPFKERTARFWATVACGLAVASTLLIRLTETFVGMAPIIASGVLFGVAQALFIYSWLNHFRNTTNKLFTLLAWATGIGHFVHLANEVCNAASLSLVLPVGAGLLFCLSPARIPNANANAPAESRGGLGRMSVCLLLCAFACGIAWFNSTGNPAGFHYLSSLLAFLCAVIVSMATSLREESIFSYLAIASCALVASRLVLPQSPEWTSYATYAGFWLLELYAIAWFSWHGANQTHGKVLIAYLGICAVYLLSGIANLVGTALPEQTACAIALALTASAFALAFAGTSKLTGEPATSSAQPNNEPAQESRLTELATAAGLTEAEYSVFLNLAKGHSLRQIASTLGVSESTAKFHRHNIYQKLGVASRQDLINLVEVPTDTK